MNRDRPLLAALALLSAAATAQQIALMQVLGWMHWHHFAYMVVALALLGLGVAGTTLSLARDRLLKQWRTRLSWLAVAMAATIPLGLRIAHFDALFVDLPLVFFDPQANVWRLVVLCLLLLPPFFCGGLATGLILTARADEAGRFYAASLAGAGCGGVLGLAMIASIEPPRLPAAVAALALSGAFCLWQESSRRVRTAASGVLFLIGLAWIFPGELQPSQFKPLHRTLQLPEARVIAARTGVHGWVQVVAAPALRPAPAVSLNFTGEIPAQPAVFVNGLGYGSLLDKSSIKEPQWLEFTTDATAFKVVEPDSVLLLENGPGGWAALSVANGANRVVTIEPNHALVDLLSDSSNPLAPEWRLPPVVVLVENGRSFLRRTTQTFDVIRFPSVGALGGTAGLASTSEQFLLTREAFVDAWQRLSPEGLIAVTAWMDFPERNPLRLLATLAEAAQTAGVEPRAHLAAVRGWATVTFLLKRTPWTTEDIASLRAFCEQRSFDPLLHPESRDEERQQYHVWQNPEFFTRVDRLVDDPSAAVDDQYPFSLDPASDDRPYFSQFLRWSDRERVVEAFGSRAMPFFELGSLTTALTALILAALAIVGIVLPLIRLRWRTAGKLPLLLYFGGLGAGFMAVEIGLMLKAHAWLGSPVFAAAFVITALLIASGLGSRWSETQTANAKHARIAVSVVAASVLLSWILLSWLEPVATGWPLPAQLALLIAIVGPLGFAMGMAFPLGLRRLETIAPDHVPWAWAINGCISVATPAAAMLLAMSAGFSALFYAGAGAYLVALLGAALAIDQPRSA